MELIFVGEIFRRASSSFEEETLHKKWREERDRSRSSDTALYQKELKNILCNYARGKISVSLP